MIFKVSWARDYARKEQLEVQTLQELLAWAQEFADPVILNAREMTLKVYDDYIE